MRSDTELLEFLIENEAYVYQSYGYAILRHVCEDEFECLSPSGCETPRDAINAAMDRMLESNHGT